MNGPLKGIPSGWFSTYWGGGDMFPEVSAVKEACDNAP